MLQKICIGMLYYEHYQEVLEQYKMSSYKMFMQAMQQHRCMASYVIKCSIRIAILLFLTPKTSVDNYLWYSIY